EGCDLLAGGGGPDQHAVAARPVDFLDHEFGQIVEHVGETVGLRAAPGGNVLEDRLLAGVEFDDLRHERIDRLVIGDAGARGIGDGDPAGTVDVHDPGHAERRGG